MMKAFKRGVAPMLLYLISVSADCGGANSTYTIQNNADATALSSCTVFSGSIAIATGTSDNILIAGVQEILGDLTIVDASNLTNVGADSLRRLDGNLNISDTNNLSALTFPSLTDIGNLTLFAVPNLLDFGFTAGISSASVVNISNTFLESLNGLNLKAADNIYIANNPILKSIALPLASVSTTMNILYNGENCSVSLPQLTTAGGLDLRNIVALDLSNLNFMSGSLSLANSTYTNTSMNSLSVIKGDASFFGLNLQALSLPALLSIGQNFTIANSNVTLVQMNQLDTVGGLNLAGSLNAVQLPALRSVNGSFSVQSSDPNFNCSVFDNDNSQGIIKGNYTCTPRSNVTTPAPKASNTSQSESARLSGGAIAGIVIGTIFAVLVAIATLAFFILRKRKTRNQAELEKENDTVGPAEIDGKIKGPTELATGTEYHEFPDEHGLNEVMDQEHHEMPG